MATQDERRSDPVRQGVGMRLKAAREGRQLSQQEVADRFGIGKGNYTNTGNVLTLAGPNGSFTYR